MKGLPGWELDPGATLQRWCSEGLAESLILRIYARIFGFALLEEPGTD